MGLFEGKTPAERNKTIVAIVLPLVALLLLLRMFFGGDSPTPRRTTNANAAKGRAAKVAPNGAAGATAEGADPSLVMAAPLPPLVPAAYNGPEAARNIFAFPPVAAARPVATPTVPVEVPPTPTPTPPL